MHTVILSPREHHNVRSLADYRRAFRAAIARKVRAGHRVSQHHVDTPLVARIEHGSWLVECECGAGNAVDPAWGIALCFSCGAEHQVIVPPEIQTIEALILARPQMRNRNWHPSETVADVRAINRKHGVKS